MFNFLKTIFFSGTTWQQFVPNCSYRSQHDQPTEGEDWDKDKGGSTSSLQGQLRFKRHQVNAVLVHYDRHMKQKCAQESEMMVRFRFKFGVHLHVFTLSQGAMTLTNTSSSLLQRHRLPTNFWNKLGYVLFAEKHPIFITARQPRARYGNKYHRQQYLHLPKFIQQGKMKSNNRPYADIHPEATIKKKGNANEQNKNQPSR